MLVDDFDFPMPEDRIALRPASPRDSARLLTVRGKDSGVIGDLSFMDLPGQLRAGDVLVVNDTRVIPAQLFAHKGEATIGVTLHKRESADRWWSFVKDFSDYQTLHASKDGAVAAPTAGLHFTPRLWSALREAGISRETVTLHVGAGTFLPVKAQRIEDHQMHAEWGSIDDQTALRLNAARADGGRIIAVGTTSLRLLESAADKGNHIRAFSGDTSIFITPGYRWKAIDGLITNFHLPRSTLFMLVSALMGLDVMRRAYAHAIEQEYRFYSYGDGSLLLP